jgi:hypothetical protein
MESNLEKETERVVPRGADRYEFLRVSDHVCTTRRGGEVQRLRNTMRQCRGLQWMPLVPATLRLVRVPAVPCEVRRGMPWQP